MKNRKKYLSLVLALLMSLSLTACGSSGDYYDGNDGGDGSDSSCGMGKLLTDEDFDADISAWQGDDGGQLVLNLPDGCYTYRTWYGRVGTGSVIHDGDDLMLIFGDLDGENDYYLV